MDDDQTFVRELLAFIENHDAVDYRMTLVDTADEGRGAFVTLTLVAGDRYEITIRELHS